MMDTESGNSSKTQRKYTVRAPYYEDTNSYNLQACIKDRRKPNFGYALPNLLEDDELGQRSRSQSNEDVENHGVDFQFMLPSVVAMRREKQIMQHVLKCFTFGKPVRRNIAHISGEGSRINEIKSKFNRVRLIRRYFSVKRSNLNRKFDYPID